MIRKTLLATGILLVGATPAVAHEPSYRAAGAKPRWSLTLDGSTMRFQAAGRRPLAARQPKPIIGFAGEIYRSDRMNVNVAHAACATDGERYHDTVSVMIGKSTWHGCGGERIGPAGAGLARRE